jgi:lysophospholipase L1-like esterase
MQAHGRIDFLDCARLMNAETKSTFADGCHLSDPGQAILGEALTDELKRLVEPAP